jgi:heptosyltransferase-2
VLFLRDILKNSDILYIIQMPKELIIMPNWVGDLALALSVVHRKTTMQHTDVTLLVPQPLVQLCGALASYPIIPYKRGHPGECRATLKQVRSQRFGAVYVLPHSFSSAWFAFRTGIKKRRGIARELRQFFFTRSLPRSIRTHERHITYEYALVLETDFVPPDYWQGAETDKSNDYAGSLVFCPGSMYGPAKQWNGYNKLIDLLPGKQIVVLGDARNSDAAEALETASPDRIVNLTGKTTLIEACRIIAGAKAVVANDSGLMHLAGYLGTPVVGIFGSTSPTWTRPLGAKVGIAHVKYECSPCFGRTCRFKHYNCLKLVTPEHVAQLVHQLLQEKPGSYD